MFRFLGETQIGKRCTAANSRIATSNSSLPGINKHGFRDIFGDISNLLGYPVALSFIPFDSQLRLASLKMQPIPFSPIWTIPLINSSSSCKRAAFFPWQKNHFYSLDFHTLDNELFDLKGLGDPKSKSKLRCLIFCQTLIQRNVAH